MISVYANVGKISAVSGDVLIDRGDSSLKASVGSILEEKDTVKTNKKSKVQLILNDNTVVKIGRNSSVKIEEFLYDTENSKNSKTQLNFFKGAFKTITGNIGKINKSKFKIKTKTASIGIRGTTILGNQNMIACTKGGISVSAFGKTVNVNEDYVTRTLSNKPPSTPEILTPKILKALESDSGDDEEDDESASSDDTQPANSKSFDFDIEQKTNDTEDNIFEEIENQVEEETTNEESTPEESPDQETPDDSTTPEESQDDVTNDDTTEDDSTPEENPEDSTPEESQEESVDTAQSESSITSTYDSVLNEVTGSDITKYSEFYSSTDSESTGSYEIEGVTSSFVSDGINMTSDVQSGKITLNTNRETGAITGTITNITEGEIIYDNINLSGNIDDESSFYIEDDLIGVKSGTAYTAISISDGMDENDNFITLDDDSSWGYWTAK